MVNTEIPDEDALFKWANSLQYSRFVNNEQVTPDNLRSKVTMSSQKKRKNEKDRNCSMKNIKNMKYTLSGKWRMLMMMLYQDQFPNKVRIFWA